MVLDGRNVLLYQAEVFLARALVFVLEDSHFT